MARATSLPRTTQEPAKGFAARPRELRASPPRRPRREPSRPMLEAHDVVARLADSVDAGAAVQRQSLATGYGDITDAARTSRAPGARVSHPTDPLEREADRVAAQVMSRDAAQMPMARSGAAPVQRKCAACSTGQPCERCTDGEAPRIQRTAMVADAASSSPSLPHTMSAGEPLGPVHRTDMEQRFGTGFANVRIHTDADAARSAHELGARAYTVGRDIVFGAGEYQPDTAAGGRLLAHELTHVMQQASGAAHEIQREPRADGGQSHRAIDPRAQTAALETQWKAMQPHAKDHPIVAEWIRRGDDVVRLLRAHTDLAVAAVDNAALFAQYLAVRETDLIAYQYTYQHLVLYINVIQISARAHHLLDAFKTDDRHFTGRTAAEEHLNALVLFADSMKADSASTLTLLRTDVPYQPPGGGPKLTLTSAGNPSFRESMQKEIGAAFRLQLTVESLVDDIDAFLTTAQHEGLNQAIEAVEEFYKIKGIIDAAKGGIPDEKPAQQDKRSNSKQERPSKRETTDKKPSPDTAPGVPLVPIESEEQKKRRCAIPVNAKEAGWRQMRDELVFAYTWESSTGSLADLAACEIRERVDYPGPTPSFPWPEPPWHDTWVNPTEGVMAPGLQGKFVDGHRPPMWSKTFAKADVTATQFYYYVCPCAQGILAISTPGGTKLGFAIRRRVLLNNDRTTYRYLIEKSGGSAQIDPLRP